MRILICGANGQLGTELVKLLEQGFGEIGAIPEEYKQAEVVQTDSNTLDITDREAVQALVGNGDFDLVINCAAMTDVDACETNEETAYKVNAVGAENLAKACAHSDTKFVHVSTDYVFAGNEPSERVEDDPTDPQNAYGRTKLAGEQLVTKTGGKYFIVRTAWLYGYVGKNFPKTIVRLAKENGFIKVVDDQRGNPTSANDLAYEILKIALQDEYGIYHCTNEGTCSWFDFASKVVDIAGIPCEKIPCTSEEFVRPAKRPAYSSLKNKKLEDTIGNEMRSWQDAIEEYLKNLSQQEG